MTNRDRPLVIPYTQIPHGLWTADLTPKAALLLGWLHSHADNYMDRLTLRRIGREFGGGKTSAIRLCAVLAEAGYVTVEPDKKGLSSHVLLMSAPWEALVRGVDPTQVHPVDPPQVQGGPMTGTQVDPPQVHIEEQLEQQVRTPTENTTSAASFGAFWKLYPRKVGKADALKAWRRMSEEHRVESTAVIESHTAMWVAEGRGTAHVPHASTWLNRESWEDEVGFIPTRDVRQVTTRASRAADAGQRFADRHNANTEDLPSFAELSKTTTKGINQ